jgi:metal transporter CNNM
MADEVNIIKSVLDLKEKPVCDVMTPMEDVFTMSADTILDEKMMNTILSQGYSRIPVYAPDNNRNFIGMLLVKILITYDPEDCKRVRDFALATLPETAPHTSCLDIINFFQEGKSHMVLVSEDPGTDHGAQGVVTLEDVIEELIGEEIVDESDVFIDVHKAIRRLAPANTKRYKMRAGQLVEDDGLLSESEREDKNDNKHVPLLKSENRKSSIPNGTAPNTTFTLRRKSSNASDTTSDPNKPVKMVSPGIDFASLAHHFCCSEVHTLLGHEAHSIKYYFHILIRRTSEQMSQT